MANSPAAKSNLPNFLQWTPSGRAVVFVLSATSIWCLLAEMYSLVDMRSTCGTYLNGDAIPVPDDLEGVSESDCARMLRSGDFFSLGPSAVNLFLFFQK